VISLNDLVLAAGKTAKAGAGLAQPEVMDLIQAISTHRTETALVSSVG
jgi:hypothetical protein